MVFRAPNLAQEPTMKHLPLKLGSIGALTGIAAFMAFGVAIPQPAGACSCLIPRYELEVADVRLMNLGDLDDNTVDEMEAEEAAAWPETASFDFFYEFEGVAGEEVIHIEIEEEE
jgi:hypothetical protein